MLDIGPVKKPVKRINVLFNKYFTFLKMEKALKKMITKPEVIE